MSDVAKRIADLSPEKRALLAQRLRAADGAPKSRQEPIAIVGLGCRFPGGSSDPEAFWDLLQHGRDAVSEVPGDRWDIDAFYDSDPATAGKMNTRWGAFLEAVDQFDPGFFGISPRETIRMDPQQRLLLEVAWEALEDAGQPIEQLAGSPTGVFAGICNSDYSLLQLADVGRIDQYVGTGLSCSIAVGRLSYLLDLRGPSVAVDTACSASLVAVHLACQSLRSKECALAIAGGVNLILSPLPTIITSKMRIMAPDGRCKTFDARADGYVRGEGCGIVVLKRLSDALADRDPIRAIIRGSAVNQDGRTVGLTAPNGLAQQAVIRQALSDAGVTPSQIGYIEAHGTGTPLGDPIEVEALRAVIGQPRPEGQHCAIGSIKTNIGHLEAAAGIAGLIKAVLALQHEAIPPHLHFEQLSPYISFENTPFVIPTELRAWPAGAERRYAGVSSFGWSGTNAHVVLEEAPQNRSEPASTAPDPRRAYLLPLSARSPEALTALAQAYQKLLADEPRTEEQRTKNKEQEPRTNKQRTTDNGQRTTDNDQNLRALCYTASVRRSHHSHRLALAARTTAELADQLAAFVDGQPHPGHTIGGRPLGRRPVAFVFSGQGGQWAGMGRTLLAQEPVFRAAIERCDQALRPFLRWSLIEQIGAGSPSLDDLAVAQPTLFALQVALAALWQSWGIAPDAVVGHSMGEVAAAHVAGALTLEDAARVIARRSQLLGRLRGRGGMALVGLSREQTAPALAQFGARLAIAVCNSPQATVVAGESEALQALMAQLEQLGVFCRQVQVDVAAHTTQVEPLLGELEVALAGLRPQTERVSIYSTVSGTRLDRRAMDAAYWARNLRAPVEFAAAVEALAADGHEVFVEVSPHPILSGAVQQGLQARGQQSWIVPSLRRNEDERRVLLESLGTLYALGQEVAWRALYPEVEECVQLPTYPWQRARYWPEIRPFDPGSTLSPAARDRPEDLDSWLYEVEWQAKSRSQGPPTAASAQPGSWLIFADRQGVGAALAERLTAQGDRAIVISPGETYACADLEHFRVRVGRAEDLHQLLQAALTPDQPICRGIVHLWNLDAPPTDEISAASLEAAQTLGCLTVIQLIQELVRAGTSTPLRLWLVTRGAQPAGDGAVPLAVAQTPIWGLGRTIAQEHPALWGGLVDLDSGASAPQAAALLSDEILSPDGEDQLAFRDRQRYVARLVRKRSTGQLGRPIRWRTDASYLIAGGLGGIDLQVARWMVEQGARRLILLGRTQLPPRAEWRQVEPDTALGQRIAAIRNLEAMGANVHIAAVDVADEPQLAAFLDVYDREGWPPIQGVVHAAGVAHPQSLLELDDEAWSAALRPKVMGGWLLHRLLERSALDFFVLFSSGSVLLSSRLLGSYAAANAFVDGLAHYRSASGLPALSINWGPWADAGMAAEDQQAGEGQFAIRGMRNLTAGERLGVLEYLLRDRSAQVAALPIDWSESSQFHPAISESPLLALVAHDRAGGVSKGPASNGRAHLTRAQLLAAEPAERQRLLELHLLAQVVNALGLSASGLDVHQPLDALGIDSLMAVELKNQIEVDLGVVVPLRELLEGPTVAHFATLLLDQLAAAGSQTSVPLATAGR